MLVVKKNLLFSISYICRVLSVWTCVSIRSIIFQTKFDDLWLMCSLNSHLSTYVNLCLDTLVSLVLYSLLMYVCKFLISPLCVVVRGAFS